ncbi:SelB C-terminal domain-containing protein, partial [Mycobacterium palustre]|nr:SelB C-terminal domain-containing protein [Mycobacterium palustre]
YLRGSTHHALRAAVQVGAQQVRVAGARELAAAVRAGRLTRIADGVVLGPDALDRAADLLKTLPQPFTVSEAKRALSTTRRVAVPLLELLDARRVTRRGGDGTRTVL